MNLKDVINTKRQGFNYGNLMCLILDEADEILKIGKLTCKSL